MEITSDQKRTICAMLAEQAGHPVRSAEITALCDDETIRAALLVLSSLIDVKYREVSAALAAARAEHERNNPQMMMGSALTDSTLSAPADIPVSLPDTAHTVFPPAAERNPLLFLPYLKSRLSRIIPPQRRNRLLRKLTVYPQYLVSMPFCRRTPQWLNR